MHKLLHILEHTLLDSVKILPFLLIAYLIMEYIEHKTTDRTREAIKKSGKFGPFVGSILGAFPQCGFSVTATNLYAGRVITIGTLFAVYLSTSDEMLPILLSAGVAGPEILKILGIKILIGMLAGVFIDLIINKFSKNKKEENKIESICEHDHCHCEESIWKSAIKHTINIFIFILVITLILNIGIEYIGEDTLVGLILNKPILSVLIACAIGLIPNCASSVVLTELYLLSSNLPAMIGGLLVNAGVGLLVLFKVNHNQKENIKIVLTLYAIGAISAMILQLLV